MSVKQFLTSRVFLRHLILVLLLLLILLIVTMQVLKTYTLHGQAIPVPDFQGLTFEQATESALKNQLKVQLVDSFFVSEEVPGVIVEQVPEAGLMVKQNRTIFLTKNLMVPEQTIFPRLTDISFRQAMVILENYNLQMGKIIYQPSEFNDLVLKALIDSIQIHEGQKVPRGATVDLVIGRNTGNSATPLPNLTGLTLKEAKDLIAGSFLNTGVIIYDNTILTEEDSLQARIWKQQPSPSMTSIVNIGTSVDLWVTVDEMKLAIDTLLQEF